MVIFGMTCDDVNRGLGITFSDREGMMPSVGSIVRTISPSMCHDQRLSAAPAGQVLLLNASESVSATGLLLAGFYRVPPAPSHTPQQVGLALRDQPVKGRREQNITPSSPSGCGR